MNPQGQPQENVATAGSPAAVEVNKGLCACGCNLPRPGDGNQTKYRPGHREKMSECRKRLRQIKNYAKRKDIECSLVLKDIRDLLFHLQDTGESRAIERRDTDLGFVPGNILLRSRKGPVRRTSEKSSTPVMTEEDLGNLLENRLGKLLEAILKKSDKQEEKLLLEDILCLYVDQDGLCALSGAPLLVAYSTYPDSISITRITPEKPWVKGNTILATYALKPLVDKWGADWVIRTAKSIAQAEKRKPK